MGITKKPYEISLWDEKLVFVTRQLHPIVVKEADYEPGKYYSQNQKVQGAIPFTIDYNPYNEGQRYFELRDKNSRVKESYNAKDLDNFWSAVSNGYRVTNIDGFKPNVTYYTYKNEGTSGSWKTVSGAFDPNKIYFWAPDANGQPAPLTTHADFQYYKEVRLCTIGSDTMDSPARAVNGKLITKVNGEVTFTFTVYYRYFDNMTGQLEYNPFMPYLVNERKVKLKYDGEWYDLIIKQIQENSETKAFTYTCKSQFINELSKTGFELEFDNELENNMGTVGYLAEQILEGSDWKLDKVALLKQFVEEPLYEIKVKDVSLVAKEMEDEISTMDIKGKTIYAFYGQITDQKKELQFLYTSEVDKEGKPKFATNDDLIIDKDQYPNYVVSVASYDENGWPNFTAYSSEGDKPALAQISTKYRGMRLVRQARTIYDSKIDKFVKEYRKEGDSNTVYYGFEETKYLSPNAVTNYIVNPSAFTSTTGWYTQPNASGARATLELATDPPFNATNATTTTTFTSYLKFPNNGGALINSSINSFKSSLEDLVEGKTKHVLRLRYETILGDGIAASKSPTSIKVCRYKDMDQFEIEDEIFVFESYKGPASPTKTNGYLYFEATCKKSVSKSELKDWDGHYGLFLNFDNSDASGLVPIYIEDMEMFPYITLIKEGQEILCVPDGELFSKVETTQKYYKPNQTYTSIEEIEFEPAGGTYELKYEEGADAFTKISSITAKESNRFNLLQDLNEKFECWSKFRVDRNEATGEIRYGKDVDKLTPDEAYRQQKFVIINEYAGNPNQVGFRYGVNSKSIQRTIDSNAITTKMIVKDNANEFAPNGFCSIARADDNTAKENFLLNFDHYYHQQLLDINVVTNDLYLSAGGYLGYYQKLREINRDRDGLIEQQANLLKDIVNYDASYQTYKTSYDSAVEERAQMESNVFLLIVPKEERETASSKTFQQIINDYSNNWTTNSNYIKYTTSWTQCCAVINQHQPLYEKALAGKTECENKYKAIAEILKEKTERKRALNLQFYKKYSRFIQEGSWIKEDYIDDNLYYLDSMSTLQTSAQPKVTYNISVIDVSPLATQEEYKDFINYNFKLGDITYIEDREFFGYSLIDGTTPYREEIVVSEITVELDAPEKNSIKVQNYKTQFEDLFQRITAQTQQAEYHTGEYKRAASIVETDGSISVSTLENSFANNSFKLSNARDQSVVIDEFGITSTSLANPSEMVRIVNGGIFMSTDGGLSWKTGLTGYGLNSSYMTAGQINTDEIYIMSGGQPAFGWDEKGISAYKLNNNTYDLGTFVRFDSYGIYGISASQDWKPTSTSAIHDNASFALTWEGFSLKNDDGSVRISTSDDIQVLQNGTERIKIGRFGSGSNLTYGIRINDARGTPVMETDGSGRLWLRDKLSVGTSDTSTVAIGYLEDVRTGTNCHEVIRAGDSDDQSFVVYEDGVMRATGVDISGTINATGGSISGVNISEINLEGYEVVISCDKGLVVGENETVKLTAKIYKNGNLYTGNAQYQWYSENGAMNGKTSNTLEVSVNFGTDNYEQYRCEVTVLKEE